MRILLALLLTLVVPQLPDASVQEERAPICRKCSSTGRLPCPEHPKDECELEDHVQFCSMIVDCEACVGVGFVDCHKCENETAEADLTKALARIAKKKAELQILDDEMGRFLRKVETEHFVLVWDLDDLKVNKRRMQDHELLHLYAQRLETLYTDYTTILEAKPRELKEKTRVFVWWLPNDQSRASAIFCGNSSPRGVKLMGARPTYSCCASGQGLRTDERIHQNLVHNVTHLLFSHQNPANWIGNIKGGWADAGLAHWFEDRYFNSCNEYCYEEQATNLKFKGGPWRPSIRKMVALDKVPPISEVMSKNTDGLSPDQHAVAFSYVDYLIHLDGAKFGQLGRVLRKKVASRDALKQTYELSPLQLEVQWKAWVLETYPKR